MTQEVKAPFKTTKHKAGRAVLRVTLLNKENQQREKEFRGQQLEQKGIQRLEG